MVQSLLSEKIGRGRPARPYFAWRAPRDAGARSARYISYIRQFLALHQGKKVNIFICGNDLELNTSLFREQLSDAHLVFPNGNPGEDLYLLSQCDYLIGAPSTFTLVASMYRDIPLCWILDADKPLQEDAFGHFDYLFQHTL